MPRALSAGVLGQSDYVEIASGCTVIAAGRHEFLCENPLPWIVCHLTQSGCVCRQGREYNMKKYRNYWAYSIVCFLVWGVILAVRAIRFGGSSTTHDVLYVFGGWCIAWVSATIARSVYPPPKRWFQPATSTP
jgi:hypothetical protein